MMIPKAVLIIYCNKLNIKRNLSFIFPITIFLFIYLSIFSLKLPKNFEVYLNNNKSYSKNIQNLPHFINVNMIDIDGKDECIINKGIYASDHFAIFCDLDINIKV